MSGGTSRGPLRIELTCELRFPGALHVGSGNRLSLVSDSPLLRDGTGDPYLPGSSVRGVLRDWCEREAPRLGVAPEEIRALFGPDRGDTVDDRQGRLTVYDTALKSTAPEVVDHVAIDRRTGAALRAAKFDQEVVFSPSGTLRVHYEGDSEDDGELLLLQEIAAALQEGILAFGGKTGWGQGWASVEVVRWARLDRSRPASLSEYLRGRLGPPSAVAAEKWQPSPAARVARAPRHGEPPPRSWLRLDLALRFEGPLLVAGPDRQPEAAHSAEAMPFTVPNPDDPDGRPILPGSSLRGVLHAAGSRLTSTLGTPELEDPAASLFGTTERAGLLRVGDGSLEGDAHRVKLDHVAIDRFTGFAALGKLFDAVGLGSPEFRVDLLVRWRADEPPEQRAVALLLFLLRDAGEGLLWVGSRTTRGYGHLAGLDLRGGRGSIATADEAGLPARRGFSVGDSLLSVLDLPELEACFDRWRELYSLAEAVAR